jgi:hypothetical protein
MLKAGEWHSGGECAGCGDIGPARFHCPRCRPEGFVYESDDMSPDELVGDPLKVELMAQRAHEIFLSEERPAASRSHFLLLLDSLWWSDEHPGPI